MRFVDIIKISLTAGHGGHGAVSFRREKYVDKGGPDGGKGGQGGHIILKASLSIQTLMDLKIKRHYKAKNGDLGRNGVTAIFLQGLLTGGRNDRPPSGVVDHLSVDMLKAAEYRKPGPLRRACHLFSDPLLANLSQMSRVSISRHICL